MSDSPELPLLVDRSKRLLQAHQNLLQAHAELQKHTQQIQQEYNQLQDRLATTTACIDQLIAQIKVGSQAKNSLQTPDTNESNKSGGQP